MTEKYTASSSKISIGWCEWCELPDFDIPYIKAKIDTGAKTSSLHAFDIERITKKGKPYVRFSIHPVQFNDVITFKRTAEIIDERSVMSSNGQKEKRYVIATSLQMGDLMWGIELTLSNRDPLRYRLLLGREALRKNVVIHPGKSCLQYKPNEEAVRRLYRARMR